MKRNQYSKRYRDAHAFWRARNTDWWFETEKIQKNNFFPRNKEWDNKQINTTLDENEESDRIKGNEIGTIDANKLDQIINGLSNLKEQSDIDKEYEEVIRKRLKMYDNDAREYQRKNNSPKNYNDIIWNNNKDFMDRIEHVTKSMKKKK